MVLTGNAQYEVISAISMQLGSMKIAKELYSEIGPARWTNNISPL